MDDKLDKETKESIDDMDYEELLSLWRFAPTGHPYFQGEIGGYYGVRMAYKQRELATGEAARISKEIGW